LCWCSTGTKCDLNDVLGKLVPVPDGDALDIQPDNPAFWIFVISGVACTKSKIFFFQRLITGTKNLDVKPDIRQDTSSGTGYPVPAYIGYMSGSPASGF
jgi:hypothetical protein